MLCKICKLKEATHHQTRLHCCAGCLFELKAQVIYYISGKEVSAEEYYRGLNEK